MHHSLPFKKHQTPLRMRMNDRNGVDEEMVIVHSENTTAVKARTLRPISATDRLSGKAPRTETKAQVRLFTINPFIGCFAALSLGRRKVSNDRSNHLYKRPLYLQIASALMRQGKRVFRTTVLCQTWWRGSEGHSGAYKGWGYITSVVWSNGA